MATNWEKMTHDEIFTAVHVGVPAAVSSAASQLEALSTTISGHLDVLDKLSTSMAEAWPDENGQNFRDTLSHTIGYLRELQATHITTASSSVTQVMGASHEKLSSTQATIPTPPTTPVAQQEANLTKEANANGGVMNQGLAMQSQHIAAAKADDAKAVTMAKSLANTYLAEQAKLTAPPAAPTGPHGTGSGSGSTGHGSSGSGSGTGSSLFVPTPGSGTSHPAPGSGGGSNGSPGPVNHVSDPGTGGTGGGGTGGAGSGTGNPVGPIGGVGGGHAGAGGNAGGTGSGVGGIGGAGANPGSPSSLLDPTGGAGSGAGAGFGGSGSDGSGGLVPGLLGGAGAATLGGLGGAGVVAARKAAAARAAEQAALLKQEEEAEAEGAGGGNLSASQIAAMNAQRNGVLGAGEEAGLMSERNLAMQQRTLGASSAAMTAEEEAELGAGQNTVPGQLGGSPVAAGATSGARAPFSAGGVVGGAERVTWLVEDRDLWSADPGVRAVVED